jgi:predicted nucleotide-binding protein (sugar kinase/HSP70/actin superfamily)
VVEQSGTPYFCFRDLDENKPVASIKIRVETIDYFLRRYREDMLRKQEKKAQIERQLAAYESMLRNQLTRSWPGSAAISAH